MLSRHIRAAWRAGITTSVTGPLGGGLVSGLSVAFQTCCGPVRPLLNSVCQKLDSLDCECCQIVDDSLLKEPASLHITVGAAARSGARHLAAAVLCCSSLHLQALARFQASSPTCGSCSRPRSAFLCCECLLHSKRVVLRDEITANHTHSSSDTVQPFMDVLKRK